MGVNKKVLEYNKAYNKEHYKSISFRLNMDSESDVITHLSKKPNLKAYIVGLIAEDMGMINMADAYEVIERFQGDYYSVGIAGDLKAAVNILADFVQSNEPKGSFQIVHRVYDPDHHMIGAKIERPAK